MTCFGEGHSEPLYLPFDSSCPQASVALKRPWRVWSRQLQVVGRTHIVVKESHTPALRPGCWPPASPCQASQQLRDGDDMPCASLLHPQVHMAPPLCHCGRRNPFPSLKTNSFSASVEWRRDIHFSEWNPLRISAGRTLDPVAWRRTS